MIQNLKSQDFSRIYWLNTPEDEDNYQSYWNSYEDYYSNDIESGSKIWKKIIQKSEPSDLNTVCLSSLII